MTSINIIPGRRGASAVHSGDHINIGTRLLFQDLPMLDHTFVHELTHNHGFTHGGLMELVVETTRCPAGGQITKQPLKWMFLDRMNGVPRKERSYKNTGLYLCCYARHGKPFLQFLLTHEQPARKNLSNQGFSDDEITAALCNLASEQDMTPICRAYGLSAASDRIELATKAARKLCRP